MSQENKKPQYIKNALVNFISLVKNGANKRQFAVKKSKEEKDISFNIIKSEKEDWTIVKGVVYEPEKFDTDNQKMTAEEIQKTAHLAVENGVIVDIEHNEKITSNPVVESFIAESDMKLGNQIVKSGSWVAAVKIKEESVRKAIDTGEINCFSMAGTAILEDIEKSTLQEKYLGREIRNLAYSYAEVVDSTFREKLSENDLVGTLETNLAQLNTLMGAEIDKLKSNNINKSKEEAVVAELTKEDIVEIVKSTMQEERKIEAEKVSKSAEKEELSNLKETVENLKEKLLKSEAGKDGAEDFKKTKEEEDKDGWM